MAALQKCVFLQKKKHFWDSEVTINKRLSHKQLFCSSLKPSKDASDSTVKKKEEEKKQPQKNRPCFLMVSCLVCFCVVSAGLPGEECQPSESRGGQAEGQVSRPGPEARRPRPPHEAATERGRLPLKTENMFLPPNPSTTSYSSVMIHLDWSKTAKLNSVPLTL